MPVLFVFSYGGRDTGQKPSMQASALSTIGPHRLLLVINPAQTIVDDGPSITMHEPKAAAGQLGRRIDNGSTTKNE